MASTPGHRQAHVQDESRHGAHAPSLVWTDAAPLVQNTGMPDTTARPPFGRLPWAAKNGSLCDPPCPVRDEVWGEGRNGAGLYLAFATNATEVSGA